MKRIVVAPDSFKESLTANQAAAAIAAGFGRVFPQAEIIQLPLADGGEGLVRALVSATGGEIRDCQVTGPLGESVQAFIGILGDGSTCVLEMAAASGLPLVRHESRNPLYTTTYGTGELIKHALATGCGKIIIGIGGSATHDGGAGMAQALGVRLLTTTGEEIQFGAFGLHSLASIDLSGLDPRLKEVEILVAVDVKNPLCGPEGAAYVYGPQKGASPEMLPLLDHILKHFAAIISRDIGLEVENLPGAGAAGGLGAGLKAFLGAQLRPGVEVVLEVLHFEEVLQQGVDLVITGEGEINRQTAFGKAPSGVAKLAGKYGVPVLALVGSIGEGASEVLEHGITAYFSIVPRPMTLNQCLTDAERLLADLAEQCARLLRLLNSTGKITGILNKVSASHYLLETYKSAVNNADINDINELKKTLEDTRTAVEVLETILNNTYDGILLVDTKGIITKINRAYLDFLGISEDEAVGKHVTDVVENSRMHIVVKTGKAEIGHTQKIQGKEMVVMRIPILKDGEVVGAVGKVMFRDVRELKSLAESLNLIESELKYYKTELQRLKGAKYSFENIIGTSEKMLKAKQLAKQASAFDSTVLICGESGTGKEIFAHAIHNYSYRHSGPFVRVNCGAIPGTLFESELFGYEKGAFTGAQKGGKPGKFELANNGTIFLDEIGEIPLDMQVKLLRVLQERELERVGGTKVIPLNVRIIAASNKLLEDLVKEKKFREDLFYRLNIFNIELPPLREIPTDIILIAKHLTSELNESLSTAMEDLSEEVVKIFQKYAWPGNIRELRNVLERIIIINRHGEIKKNHLPLYLLQNQLSLVADFTQLEEHSPLKLEMVVREAEKAVILRTLALTNNNKRQAAHLLGIHRSALYQKLKKYGLEA